MNHDDTEARMRAALQRGATSFHLPEAGAETARQRAGQHARRRRAATGGVMAAVLAVGGIAAWENLPTRTQHIQMTDGTEGSGGAGDTAVGSAPPAQMAEVPANLEWREADGVVSRSQGILVGEDGRFYLLSTAPGTKWEDYPEGNIPQALYTSADGLSWEVAEQGAEPWIADLDTRDGVLYAISTAPGTTGTDAGRIGVSADGGATWEHTDLPSTAAPPAGATVPIGEPYVGADIAVGESVMVASVRTQYFIDGDDVFGAELDESRWWTVTEEGVALMEACVDGPLRVDERGDPEAVMDDPVDLAEPDPPMDDADPEAPLGERHEIGDEVALEDVPDVADRICDEDDAVVRTVPWAEIGLSGPGDLVSHELFVSTDGADWERVDGSPLGTATLQSLTATTDGFFAVSYGDGDRTRLHRSADGIQWDVVEQIPGWVSSIGFVGQRIVASTHGEEGAWMVYASDDGGTSWSESDLTSLIDPAGDYHYVGSYAMDTGPLGIALVAFGYSDDQPGDDRFLLTSSDATNWSVTPLADVVGDEVVEISWVAVGADSIALTAVHPRGEDEEFAPSTTFVGTPQR